MFEKQLLVQQVLDVVEPFFPAGVEIGVCYNNLVAMAGTGPYRNKIGTVRPHNIYNEVIETKSLIVIEKMGCDARCSKCQAKCEYKTLITTPILHPVSNEVIGLIALLSRDTYIETCYYIGVVENLAKVVQTISDSNLYDAPSLSTILNVINDSIIMVDHKGYIVNSSAKAVPVIKPRSNGNPLNITEVFPELQLSKKENILNERRIIVYPVRDTGYVLKIEECTVKKPVNAFSSIIGSSKAITELKKQAVEIAAMNANVLIYGETGTGKELIVKAIHQASHKKSLVVVNCGAIPENLMESELFGYVGGAFTGASKEGKLGKFELANGGTLFLDEIGELPLSLQAKLLRVLEDKCIDRLGGQRPLDIDVRVIAATNRDLGEMVNLGKFRQDLYYRLNVFMLELPPLRDRKADISALVDHYSNYFNAKFTKNSVVDASLMDEFLRYSWPGNIRELRNVLEYCFSLAKNDVITRENLPVWMQKQLRNQKSESVCSVEKSEKEFIQEAIHSFGKSTEGKKQAAKELGISLATLYRKMGKYGIL